MILTTLEVNMCAATSVNSNRRCCTPCCHLQDERRRRVRADDSARSSRPDRPRGLAGRDLHGAHPPRRARVRDLRAGRADARARRQAQASLPDARRRTSRAAMRPKPTSRAWPRSRARGADAMAQSPSPPRLARALALLVLQRRRARGDRRRPRSGIRRGDRVGVPSPPPRGGCTGARRWPRSPRSGATRAIGGR